MAINPDWHQHTPFNNTVRHLSLFVLVVWFGYLVLAPFYVFPKGRPQPADFLLICAVLPVLATLFLHYRNQRIKPVYLFGGIFVALTVGINCINYLFFPDIRFLLTAMIYPYNFMVFIFIVWMFQKDLETAKLYTFYGIAVSIVAQVIFINFTDLGFRGYRGTAGFENPNQLAYWVLLTSTMIILLRRNEKIRLVDWALLLLLMYMQSLALSKAGIIAHSTLILFLLVTPKISTKTYLVLISLVAVIGSFLLFNPLKLETTISGFKLIENVAERLEGIGTEPDDSPEARGYYRIIQFPIYTLLGSGEGAFHRFNTEGYNRELHSGMATILFSYGITGALLFFSFIFLILYKQPWYYILLFIPVILFGLPHQSFRFADFWVLLGINYGIFLAQRNLKPSLRQKTEETEKLNVL